MTVRETIVSSGQVVEKISGLQQVRERVASPGRGQGGNGSLYVSDNPPTSPNYPYIRFQLDSQGDIEAMFLGVPD